MFVDFTLEPNKHIGERGLLVDLLSSNSVSLHSYYLSCGFLLDRLFLWCCVVCDARTSTMCTNSNGRTRQMLNQSLELSCYLPIDLVCNKREPWYNRCTNNQERFSQHDVGIILVNTTWYSYLQNVIKLLILT